MNTLHFISYNVKGINHPIKRKKIIDQLKRLNFSVALLQETHLSAEEHKKLRRASFQCLMWRKKKRSSYFVS